MMLTPIFDQVCAQAGIPAPEYEYHWHPTRKFRADFAWPAYRVLLECEGGLWVKGKHGRGAGIVKDIEKQNEAAARGWLVLRCQPKQIYLTKTMDYIRAAIATRKAA